MAQPQISGEATSLAAAFRDAKRTVSAGAFTIMELLVVISIIITLAALTLGTIGYVQKKGARSRAESEIAALSAALESYKADTGAYPRDAAATDTLDPRNDGTAGATYQKASQYLYVQLSGDADYNGSADPGAKSYMQFKDNILGGPRDPTSGKLTRVDYIRDPFGNSYGYSTINQVNPAQGYNPTFDLWSTAGTPNKGGAPDQAQWLKNW